MPDARPVSGEERVQEQQVTLWRGGGEEKDERSLAHDPNELPFCYGSEVVWHCGIFSSSGVAVTSMETRLLRESSRRPFP